jgi:DMSO/TMAO reductase YedYZ heme-binding membrane subunit
MTVLVIVACLSIAGAELLLARGARRVSDRLARLEAVTLRQDERITSMAARLESTGQPRGAGPDESALPVGVGLIRITNETTRLRERMNALEDARRLDRDLYARLDGAVESLERVFADVFRLTVGELDQAAARTLHGVPVDPPGDPRAVAPARGGPRRGGTGRGGLGRAGRGGLGRGGTGRGGIGGGGTGRGGRGRRAAVAVALAATTSVLVGAATLPNGAVLSEIQRFLDTYSGALALVALTFSVITGLVATGRVLLTIRYRILAQAVHRTVTLAAIALLGSHMATALLTRDAQAIELVLPIARTRPLAVGTIAAQLTLLVAVTGLARRRFTIGRRPWLWRAVHRLAYAGWSLAVLHGLLAGRRPAGWVTWSYALCLAAVGVALLTRGFVIIRSRGAETRSPRPRPGGRGPGRPESKRLASKRLASKRPASKRLASKRQVSERQEAKRRILKRRILKRRAHETRVKVPR